MTALHVFLIASLTWIVWIPAVVLEKRARGEAGSVSIFPVIPVFPLAAWGSAYLLDLLLPAAGTLIVGGGHVVLMAAMLFSIVKSALTLRNGGKG
jgi:hypothetical protein